MTNLPPLVTHYCVFFVFRHLSAPQNCMEHCKVREQLPANKRACGKLSGQTHTRKTESSVNLIRIQRASGFFCFFICGRKHRNRGCLEGILGFCALYWSRCLESGCNMQARRLFFRVVTSYRCLTRNMFGIQRSCYKSVTRQRKYQLLDEIGLLLMSGVGGGGREGLILPLPDDGKKQFPKRRA